MMFLKAVNAAKTPGIVTSNLSLYLSAHNPNSYGGSGPTWTDLSTNANHGTLINGPTYNSGSGGYIEFDGVNDYGDKTSATGTPFAFGTGAFTVEYWVQYLNTTVFHTILDCRGRAGGSSQFNGYTDYYDATLDKFKVYTGVSDVLSSNATLAANTWYHIVVSRTSTSTNQTRLYINNSLDRTTTVTSSFTDYAAYYLGRNFNATPTYGNIRIAQLRTYKGKGLTAAEVKQNYNAHRRLYGL